MTPPPGCLDPHPACRSPRLAQNKVCGPAGMLPLRALGPPARAQGHGQGLTAQAKRLWCAISPSEEMAISLWLLICLLS